MFRISPSILGNYFFLDCERMLRYTVTSQDQKQEENIPTELSMKTLVT